jgi:hypothetical protein
MKPVAWFLAVAMLAGCASAAAKATVKFRKLQEGAYAAASYDQPAVVIARDAETYGRIWNNLIGRGAAPAVDFAKESVVFFIDQQRSTGGYSLVPAGVTLSGGNAVVKVTMRHPQRGNVVTQVLTSPFVVIAVAAPNLGSAEWVDAEDGKPVARDAKAQNKSTAQ